MLSDIAGSTARSLAAVASALSSACGSFAAFSTWSQASVAGALAMSYVPLRGAHLSKRPCLRMHPTRGRRATLKRPPWTLFPRRPEASSVRQAPLVESPPPKRPRNIVIDRDPSPPRGTTGHDLRVSGDYEWCRLCGRASAASRAGRLQQWRRPCVPLPSFQRKLAKRHLLVFDGQWHCSMCPCPSLRLTSKRCRGPSSTPIPDRPSPVAAPGNEAPPGPTAIPSAAVKRQLTLRDFFSVGASRPPAPNGLSKPTGDRMKSYPWPFLWEPLLPSGLARGHTVAIPRDHGK